MMNFTCKYPLLPKKDKSSGECTAPDTRYSCIMSTVSSSSSRTGNVQSMVNRLSQNFVKPETIIRKNPIDKKKMFVSRFSYQAEHPDELTFEVGVTIEGIEEAEEGWMKGRLLSTGQTGMFPLNFVEPSTEDSELKKEKPEDKITDSNSKPVDKIVTATTRTTENAGGIRPTNKRMSTNNSDMYANVPIVEKEKPRERAKVLYKYDAEQPDEMSIDAGALVTIVRRKVVDDGWLEVEYKGKMGLFPENFVKILPPEDKPATSNQPPTPPPVKPKPSTPSGSVPPPLPDTKSSALSASLTGGSISADEPISSLTTSSKIKELQKQIFPAGRNPPIPGARPPINRPLTVIGNADLPESRIEKDDEQPSSNEKIANHLIKDKPKQKQKRPPSMLPSASSVNGDGSTSQSASATTTSFPVKESPPVTINKPALLPKEPEKVEKPDKNTVRLISQEAIIVPNKKSTIVHSTGSVSSTHSTNSIITQEESEFVSRKDYNLLLLRVAQLEKQVKELMNRN